MSKKLATAKARRILGSIWAVPKNWDIKYLTNWFRKNEAVELQPSDVEPVSLLEVPRGSHLSIGEMIERSEMPINKPRLIA